MHNLTNTTIRIDHGAVFFNPPVAKLTDSDMVDLTALWEEGLCPVCLEEIPLGDVICDDCLEQAQARRKA